MNIVYLYKICIWICIYVYCTCIGNDSGGGGTIEKDSLHKCAAENIIVEGGGGALEDKGKTVTEL